MAVLDGMQGQPAKAETPSDTQAQNQQEADVAQTPSPAEINKMNGKQLDALYGQMPWEIDNYSTLKVADKKAALIQALYPDSAGAVATQGSVLNGEIVEGNTDLIAKTAFEIENLNESQCHAALHQIVEDTEFSFFKMGGVLSKIQENGWFGEHGSLKEYIEAEFNIKYRTAMYAIQIYNDLVEAGVPWDKVKAVGWTKIKEVSPVLTSDNVDHWVEKAKTLTTKELIEEVKQFKGEGESNSGGDDAAPAKTTTMTFKAHEDQAETIKSALDKAKEAAGTTVDTVALEFICLEFVNNFSGQGGEPAGPPSAEVFQSIGYEKVLELFEEAFPDINLAVEV